MTGQRFLNGLMKAMLCTPGISMLLGRRLLTLHLVGRKSGRRISVPVAYFVDGEELLVGTSAGWKHNLETGQPVAIRLRGRRRRADVVVSHNQGEVIASYGVIARANPTFAGFNAIGRTGDGTPDQSDLHRAWANGAWIIRLRPLPG